MTSEHLKSYKISIIISIIISVVMVFIDIRVSNGLMLGLFASYIYLWVISYSAGEILKNNNSNKWSLMLSFAAYLLLMSIVFFMTFMLPNIFNYWGLFIGLVEEKVIYLLMNIRG